MSILDGLDRWAGSLAFGFVYTLMYSGPFIVLWLLIGSPDGAAAIALGVSAFVGFLLASYRTKHAAEAWASGHMSFREAHRASWAVVRANLGFLPVVGRFFRHRKEGTIHKRSVAYVIVAIMAVAAIGAAWHFLRSGGQAASAGLEDKELPRIIDSQVKEDIIRRFAQHWHDGDARSIELMFGLEAGEDLVDALKRWKSSLGDIVEGVYSHHQHVQPAGDQDLFHLFYSVRFETEEGMVIFQVRCDEGSYKLVGFGVPASPDN